MKLEILLRMLIVPFLRLFAVLFKPDKANESINIGIEKISKEVNLLSKKIETFELRFDNLEKNVQTVIDLHKNPTEINNLKDEISKVIDVYTSNKPKIKNLLKSIMFDTENMFQNILHSDFQNLDSDEIYEKLKQIAYSKSAKKNDEIEIIIKMFVSDLMQISKKYDNGRRLEKFISLCKDLFTDVAKVLINCIL